MKFKNDVEIQNSDLTISNTGAAHLILNGDSNNSGDAGQEDAIIDFLADGGTYGYRLNSENYSQKSAFNIQENRNGTYTSRLYIDKDGDVGIGTDSPDAKLDVNGGIISTKSNIITSTNLNDLRGVGSYAGYNLTNSPNGTGWIMVDVVSNGNDILSQSAYDVYASQNTYTRYSSNSGTTWSSWVKLIDSNDITVLNSNVGIGTTNPQAKLNVVAGNTVRTWTPTSGTSAIFESSNSSRAFVSIVGANQSELLFGDAGSQFAGRVRYNHPDNKLSLWANASQYVTLDSTGNLGVGTTDPKVLLHLRKDTTTAGSESIILLDNRQGPSTSNYYSGGLWGAGYRDVTYPGYLAGIDFLRTSTVGGLSSAGEMIFYTTTSAETLSNIRASKERMRIDSIGNVGIGTDDPSELLNLSSTGSARLLIEADTDNITETDNAQIILKQDGGAVVSRLGFKTGTNSLEIWNQYNENLIFGTNNTQRLYIQSSGASTFTGVSDYSTVKLSRFNTSGNTTHRTGLVTQNYLGAEQDTAMLIGYVDATQSVISLGGSSSLHNTATKLRFYTAANTTTLTGTERMTILSNGYVGINDPSPSYQLDVAGDVKATSYINQRVAWNTSFSHTSNNVTYFYYIPTNSIQERNTNFYFNNWIAQYGGRVKKVIMRNTGSSTVPTATTIAYKVTVNGTTVFTSGYVSITGTGNDKKSSYTFTDTDATFNEGDRVQVSFNTNGNLYYTAVGISLEYTE